MATVAVMKEMRCDQFTQHTDTHANGLSMNSAGPLRLLAPNVVKSLLTVPGTKKCQSRNSERDFFPASRVPVGRRTLHVLMTSSVARRLVSIAFSVSLTKQNS